MSTACSRAELNQYVPVSEVVHGLFGDTTVANMFLVGVAFQAGALPISLASLRQAVELNGVAVGRNLVGFTWGRQWVVDASSVLAAAGIDTSRSSAAAQTGDPIERLASDLSDYQSPRYAARFSNVIGGLRNAEYDDATVLAVAKGLHKLMAYKDEYEVARHLLSDEAKRHAEAIGGPGAKIHWMLHPPILKAFGLNRKIRLGSWATPAMVMLRSMKRLRGTPFDVFGWNHMRRLERSLRDEFERTIRTLVEQGASGQRLVEVSELVELIRGYEQVKLDNVEIYRQRLAALLAEPEMALAES